MYRVVVLAALLLVGVPAQPSRAAELKVNYPELAALLRTALNAAEVYLHNKPNDGLLAFIGPKQSYIKVGATQHPITVPPHPVLGTQYYVNQIASTKITVAAVKGAVRVSVGFKSEGAAIVASSTAVPWVAWQNAAIDIDFKPIKVAKGLSFEVTRVAMQGPFDAFCPPNDGFASVACDLLSLGATKQRMVRIRGQVEAALKQHLNSAELRDQFAETMGKYLSLAKTDEIEIRIRDVKPVADGVVVSFCISRC